VISVAKYKLGQRIYYTGDMASQPGWFKVTLATDDKWGIRYTLQEEDAPF
jgi:hypothetical protein